MYFVNFVRDDEELLEPYEWQEDDSYQQFIDLPIYRVNEQTLHDFLYGKLYIPTISDSYFVVSDTHYSVVIQMKDHYLYKRGTVTFHQKLILNYRARKLPLTTFHYRILEEAYEKEFGLTRLERMKKICIEEVIDELFVVEYDIFKKICYQLHIHDDDPHKMYQILKQKLDKGYSSLHELLYKEYVQKR